MTRRTRFTVVSIVKGDKIPYKEYAPRMGRNFNAREFIAWDGEGTAVNEPIEIEGPKGKANWFYYEENRELIVHERKPQPYVLLANSKGDSITREDGLGTLECIEFLLESKARYPRSIFVGYGFNYDINQILRDIPETLLRVLHERNRVSFGGYFIKWLPRKSLYIKHRRTKRSVIIYDVFGFFQTSFLQACKEYLGVFDSGIQTIEKGKALRPAFSWEDMDFIERYNAVELDMLVRMMEQLRKELHEVGIHPSQWHGPGAIANAVLNLYGVTVPKNIPEEVGRAAQYAYAGGRFEQFRLGRNPGSIYEYDIRSAYPSALAELPDLTNGYWEYVKTWEPESFGVWYIDYRSPYGVGDNRPQPLFCRSELGNISYPREVRGWYWTPEAALCSDNVSEGYVFRPTTDRRPFAFVEGMYEQRAQLKRDGNSAQRALKLVLNSLYGKLAQTVGGKDGPPKYHCLEYAGYITATTRAMIYKAIMQHPWAIVACETDAVFSGVKLDLPLSEKLGDWELKEHSDIVYLQSGFYYADNGSVCKYRGMDRDGETGFPVGLPYRDVLDHLRQNIRPYSRPTPPLISYTTRFIGLGLGLRTNAVWRSWEKKAKITSLDQNSRDSKRFHLRSACTLCHLDILMYEGMHPMRIGGYSGRSYARALPWKKIDNPEDAVTIDWNEYLEMRDDLREFASDVEKWQ